MITANHWAFLDTKNIACVLLFLAACRAHFYVQFCHDLQGIQYLQILFVGGKTMGKTELNTI